MANEKPFIATLTDRSRLFIEGSTGRESFKLIRDTPQRVSAAVASVLRDSQYEIQITGDEPAKLAKSKDNKGATDGTAGSDNIESTGSEKTGSEEDAEKTGSEESGTASESGEAGA